MHWRPIEPCIKRFTAAYLSLKCCRFCRVCLQVMAYLCAKCDLLVCMVYLCAEYGLFVCKMWRSCVHGLSRICVQNMMCCSQNMAYLYAEYDVFVCRIWRTVFVRIIWRLIYVQNMAYLCEEIGIFVCKYSVFVYKIWHICLQNVSSLCAWWTCVQNMPYFLCTIRPICV